MRAKTREKVHFVGWQEKALFASKAIINVFLNSFELRARAGRSPKETWSEEIFSKNVDFISL